ncbi:MAG TPA: pilus assembly protein N-terminal domain-containing protein [Candidatus Angelobacter sp.]|nr:pilus assembly protein N-terminal domain-containing protein [Candidatus Angelobacter sp.]
MKRFLAVKGRGGILKLDGTKRLLFTIGGIIVIAASLCPDAMAQGAVPPSTQQPVTPQQQSIAPAQQAEPTDNFAGNQVLHILVGHSVVIRTDARLRRVLVGNPAVVTTATTAANELVVTAIASGSSSVVLWQEDNKSRILEVFGDLDVSLLREAVARGFPNEQIQVEAEENRIVLTGTATAVPVADQIAKMAVPFSKEIVNSIRIALPGRQKQILLKVKFAQVDRAKMSSYGFNLFSTGAANTIGVIGTQQFGPPQLVKNDNSGGTGSGTGVPTSTIGLSDLLNIFIFRPDINLGATIKDLQQRNLLQILAEPNLLAANGEAAKFLAGGEMPYPVVSGVAGANTVSVQFKPFGVKLEFTGLIQDDNTIRLKVYPEVSSLDFSNAVTVNGFVLPAIATRHAETVVDLRDGQSFGIAGLLDQRTVSQYSKVPGIGDIPILGLLFHSKTVSKTNSELVVIVTPSIVDPASSPTEPPHLPKEPTAPLDPKHFDSKIPSGGYR